MPTCFLSHSYAKTHIPPHLLYGHMSLTFIVQTQCLLRGNAVRNVLLCANASRNVCDVQKLRNVCEAKTPLVINVCYVETPSANFVDAETLFVLKVGHLIFARKCLP
eukprot:GEMP01103758.1.p1 GENE.GEMP01103758.1~~GEMP01103758.1.p1  ORF type:complete len:107 (-),score=1.39 GEMP01103758.1:433-753(-)